MAQNKDIDIISSEESERSDGEVQTIRNIQLLTDDHLNIKNFEDNLANCNRFVHTPKEGYMPKLDQNFFVQKYSENLDIQNFMKHVDGQFNVWANH